VTVEATAAAAALPLEYDTIEVTDLSALGKVDSPRRGPNPIIIKEYLAGKRLPVYSTFPALTFLVGLVLFLNPWFCQVVRQKARRASFAELIAWVFELLASFAVIPFPRKTFAFKPQALGVLADGEESENNDAHVGE
jgi:hypothetical protein